MTISKGFLNRKHELNANNLIGALLLWTLVAYIFYAFFQVYREAFRFFMGHLGDQTLLILTPHENYIYNLFYAAIASAIGYSFALRFTLQNSLYGHDSRAKSLIRRTLNIEGFYTWSFLFWFGKLGSIIGIWYMTYAMQFDLDLIKEFPIMLLTIPLILFYSSWPNFSRVVRTKKAWWFIRLTAIFMIMSFCFAFKNFLDYKKINENYLSRSIEHVFDLKVPKSQSHQKISRRSISIDVYIVRDTLDSEEPVIFFDNIYNRIYLQDIQKAVVLEKDKVSTWQQHQLTANLHIDERISLGRIKLILNELRRAGLSIIQYSTGRKYSQYPPDYPLFKYSGIQKKLLPIYYPELENFLDSAEQIDLAGKAVKFGESLMYRNGSLKKFNRIEITLTPNSVTLNGQEIESEKLEHLIYGFIKKYSPNYVIIFNSDDKVTYKRYIEMLDNLWTQVDRLRNELSIELYNEPFDHWYWEPELDSIKMIYPRNILEWSIEEQRLNELIKKAGNNS